LCGMKFLYGETQQFSSHQKNELPAHIDSVCGVVDARLNTVYKNM
jgi:hypothetical protein